jgi:hypothetical protein
MSMAAFTWYSCNTGEPRVTVPDVVEKQFASLYPDTKSPKWEMEEGDYEAEFTQNNVDISVRITPSGNLVQTETEMKLDAIPSGIKDYVDQQLGGKKITESSRIVTPEGKISFEVEVDKQDYLFDDMGNFVGKEKDEAGEDDKD